MRPYNDFEQEQIARAAEQSTDRSFLRSKLAGGTGARDVATNTNSDAITEDGSTADTPAALQLLVDLESESKFRSLLRMIQRRLSWM